MSCLSSFVVVWQDHQTGTPNIRMRRFNASGQPITGDELVNSPTANAQTLPSITSNRAGDFAIAWQSLENGQAVIKMKAYHADGERKFTARRVATAGRLQPNPPGISMDHDGRVVVVWEGAGRNNTAVDAMMRGYRSSGWVQFSSRPVHLVAQGNQLRPRVAHEGRGNIVVAWDDDRDGNGYMEVFTAKFTYRGVPLEGVPNHFTVNTRHNGHQYRCDIAGASDGSFSVV